MRNAPNWRRILLLVVASSLLLYGVLVGSKLLNHKHAIATGCVMDSSSGEPVANAKVVVTTWRRYLASVGSPKNYGTTTDSLGRFHVDVVPGYWISHTDVAVSTPDNKYAFQSHIGAEFIELAAGSNLSAEEQGLPCFRYDTFAGPWDVEIDWLNDRNALP